MIHSPMFKMREIDVNKMIKIIEQFWKNVFVHTTEVAWQVAGKCQWRSYFTEEESEG